MIVESEETFVIQPAGRGWTATALAKGRVLVVFGVRARSSRIPVALLQ
ncbi:hypothetical protein [Streptosporangium amethystogenes]|nr:hypothetical protein [Streptosporangium amethystogenes]